MSDDPEDLVKKRLEVRKLQKEIAQLSFAVDKQTSITVADDAGLEKRKRELERDKLEQELNKLKKEREQQDEDSKPVLHFMLKWSRVVGPFGSSLTGITALALSVSSLIITKQLSRYQELLSNEQTNKLKADQILDQDKFFRETLREATDSSASTPIFRRVAFIRALDAFWNERQSPALASALFSMLVHDPSNEIQKACVKEIKQAYSAAGKQSDRTAIDHIFFGWLGSFPGDPGRLGAAQDAWGELTDQPKVGDVRRDNQRKADLLNIISGYASHLEKSNFHDFIAEGLLLEGVNFAGSYLQGLQAKEWSLNEADLSDSDISDAKFEDCSLNNAKLIRAKIAGARFVGSDLENANFTDVTGGCSLKGANVVNVRGLDQATRDKAFGDGAVEMSAVRFSQWKRAGQNLPSDPVERQSWRKLGFPLDTSGNPILSDGQTPRKGLERVSR